MDKEKTCYNCEECICVGEGGFLCCANKEHKLVIDDFEPTDDFYWCKGRKFKKDE